MAFSGSQITRLGLYGGTRAAYPGFVAKAAAVVDLTSTMSITDTTDKRRITDTTANMAIVDTTGVLRITGYGRV